MYVTIFLIKKPISFELNTRHFKIFCLTGLKPLLNFPINKLVELLINLESMKVD